MQENIRECFQIRKIRETFLPRMIPVIWYVFNNWSVQNQNITNIINSAINCTCFGTILRLAGLVVVLYMALTFYCGTCTIVRTKQSRGYDVNKLKKQDFALWLNDSCEVLCSLAWPDCFFHYLWRWKNFLCRHK